MLLICNRHGFSFSYIKGGDGAAGRRMGRHEAAVWGGAAAPLKSVWWA